MAGFFDKLIGSEAAPEDRDYKTREELSSPEEQQAYQAGADTSVIPGLDYAKSLFRGLGREVSGADMGSQAGEQYQQEMEAHRQRQAESERLRQAYPEAYRGGQNVGSEDYPVEAMVLGVQPMTSSIMRGLAGGTKYSRPNLQYGEFREVPPDAQVGASRAPAQIGYEPKIEYQPGPEAYWQEGGAQAPRGPLPEVKVKDNSQGWHYWDRPNYDRSIDYPRSEGATPFKDNATPRSIMDLHQQRIADINAKLNPSLRMPARSFLGTKDMGTNLLRSEYTDPEIANAIALSRKNFQSGPFSRAYDRPDASGKFPGPTKGALEGSYAIGRLGEVTPVAKGPEEISSILQRPTSPTGWRAKLESFMPESEAPSVTAPPRVNSDSLAYNAKSPFARRIMGLGEDIDAQASEAAQKEASAKYGAPSLYRPKDLMKLDGSVEEEPGSLNFGVKREGYQEPKRSYVLPKAMDIAGRTGAAGSIPLAIALAADRNKKLGALPPWNPNIKSDVGPQTMAGRYGVEPVPVLANTPKDEPSAEQEAAPKAAPKAAQKDQPKATPKRATPKRAAPRSTGKSASSSNEKYWGDWRDAPGFADDPIGNFIDSITGQQKRAAKPGRANVNRELDLGSLFPFADGGMVRKHYEEGGAEDRIPIVSDIGDALGSLFQGGEQPVVAKDRAEEAPADKSQGFGGLNDFFERWSTNPLSQLLFASGAATMASPSTNPWQATGEGLTRGLEYMQAAQANQARLREKEEARRERLRQQKILEGLDNPEPVTAPIEKTAEAEPEIVAPNTKVAESEPAVNAPVAEPKTQPEEAEPKSPVSAPVSAPREPVTGPVVAADDGKINSLYALHNKIGRAMGSVTDPQLRMALASKQRNVEFEIQRIETQRKAAEDRAQKLLAETRLQQQEERIKEQSTPEYKANVESQKITAKKMADEESGAFEAADQAKNLIEQFDPIKKALEDGTLITGAYGADRHNTHKTILAATGRDSDLRSRLGDYMNSAALKQAFAQLGGRLGSGISNSDREAIMGMGVSLDNDKNYNIDSIIAFQNAQKRNLEYAKWVQEYKEDHGGKLGVSFLKDAQEWKEKQPSIVPDRLKKAMGMPISKKKETSSDETPKSESRTIVRTGIDRNTGKKVIKYSDGTTEYAD